ncbi:MAG: redoxin family protein [Ignavibacteriales bacterium]|nr:redoxin family protein [Ignavibacteriales bacterium]
MRDKKKLFYFGSIIIIVLLGAEVVLLTIQNNQLKNKLQVYVQPEIDPLRAGDTVKSFRVQTLGGGFEEYRYEDYSSRHLFFILSTSCPHCLRNLPNWNKIAEQRTDNVNIFGISTDDIQLTKNYLETKDVKFYLTSLTDTTFKKNYKIGGVPTTILVNEKGVVENVWVGAFTDSTTNEIIKLLKPIRRIIIN